MMPRNEQLYRLLPAIYRTLDQAGLADDQKGPLRELLAVIGEQTNLLEDDLQRWYDNWFIETCEDWVVPYIGDLVGYESAAKELDTKNDPESPLNRAVVFPRREVADTIALRRRKGTLALLEELSRRIVGWPARAVEFRTLVSGTAALNFLCPRRSATVDLRDRASLPLLGTAFEQLPRSVDVRRIDSHRTTGRHNLPAVALFVYRRKIDSATVVPAWAHGTGEICTFDVQGIDTPLHTMPCSEQSTYTIADSVNLPLPISRRMLRAIPDDGNSVGASTDYYGVGKSLFIVTRYEDKNEIVPPKRILVKDLSVWDFKPTDDQCDLVAVDPELGRLAFPPDNVPNAVWTTYHYGRAAFIGGGEYERTLEGQPTEPVIDDAAGAKLSDVLAACHARNGGHSHAIIEIADNAEHSAEFAVTVGKDQTLEIRAANYCRPYLRVSDRIGQEVEKCHFHGLPGSRLILNGLLFGEGEILLDGEFDSVQIRHCTLTPGKTQLVIRANETEVRIEESILGEIVTRAPASKPRNARGEQTTEEAALCPPRYDEPIRLRVFDSIIDGAKRNNDPRRKTPRRIVPEIEHALSGSGHWAHARLSAIRTTVFGEVETHEVEMIENSIFRDRLCVQNSLIGCVRFSYVPLESRTPAQFHAQPSLAIARLSQPNTTEEPDAPPTSETARVAPRFLSTSYGEPDYARLRDDCASEILQGADDEGEMGVYHNEFFPQRAAHLRTRLQEFVPAGNDIEVLFEA